MKSTAPAVLRQTMVPLQIAPRSLAAAFARMPDPLRVASVTYPPAAVLSLAVAALLANQLSEPAIAQWGSDNRPSDCGSWASRWDGRSANRPCNACSARWMGGRWRRRCVRISPRWR
jgi:hypothetical protein